MKIRLLAPFEMKKISVPIILLFALIASKLYAQTASVKGKITDIQDNSDIVGAVVMLKNDKDTLPKSSVTTNLNGNFSFSVIRFGKYDLVVKCLGYKSFKMPVTINLPVINLGELKLGLDSTSMEEVEIVAHIEPMKQNGDTIEYNANAFPTDPDAELEDLLSRLPGITIDNGVKAQGEDIQQILLDNRPYFAGDLDAALKNIPAETIDKIQVYYKPSDQSKFTGFDDGQSIKVINIITKQDKRNGEFGKAYAGYGTNRLYDAKADLDFFNVNRRITAIGSSNYTTSGQGGVNNTNTLELNYGDSIGKKVFLTGSYAYHNIQNATQSSLSRIYFSTSPANETYNETDAFYSFSHSHSLNLKMECHFDTMNMLNIAPSASVNGITNSGSTNAETIIGTEPQSITSNSRNGGPSVVNASANILFAHKFEKKGRTLSINFNAATHTNGDLETLNASDHYPGAPDSLMNINQASVKDEYGFNISPTINYTEPINKNSLVQIDYSYSYNTSRSSQLTENYDTMNGMYDKIDTMLTNAFEIETITHKAGIAYRLNEKNYSLNINLNYQEQSLNGQNDYFNDFVIVNKPFSAVLPSIVFNYKFSKKSNININYQTSTSMPSVFQLQNFINNTNPLLLTTGNPNLQQQYTQNISLRYGFPVSITNSININLSASSAMHTVASSIVTAAQDSTLPAGFVLHRGSQLMMPVNLNGAANVRANFSYAIRIKKIESNFSLNGGVAYVTAPGLVNNMEGFTNTWTMNGSAMLSGHTKEKFDYSLNYSPTYSIVKNTSTPQADNNYYTQNMAARAGWTIWNSLVLNTDFNYRVYTGLNTNYYQGYALWNASIGKKFFKKQNGQVKFTIYDILNSQNSLSHTVTDIYVQNRQTNVLTRYYLLTFVYQLRNYKNSVPATEK